MADQRLVDYIKKQKQAGYSNKQLKDYLIQNGYNSDVIKDALKAAGKHAKPEKNALVPYVKKYLGQGYTAQGIRNFLIQKGYPAGQVDDAIHAATHPKVTHIIEFSPKVIATILVVILGLGLIGASLYYFIGMEKAPDLELLDYSISIQQTAIEPGGVLYFTNNFVNFGTDRRYDISVEYFITNRDTGEEIEAWKELFAIDTVLTKQMSFNVPDDLTPGNYMVTGEVSYGDFTEDAYRTFKVIELGPEESCFDGIMNQDETSVDCGGVCEACESCFDSVQNQDETSIDCGGVCDPCEEEPVEVTVEEPVVVEEEEYDQAYVLGLAEQDPSTAAEFCQGYADTDNKDSCLGDVADMADDYTYCHDIISDLSRDDCYMAFAYEKDFGACEYIANPFVKQSCNQLEDVNDIQQSIEDEDYSALADSVGITIRDPEGNEVEI